MKTIKNVVVIGASGGSGKHTVAALLNEGKNVTVVSRKASEVFDNRVRCVNGSALDKAVLTEAIQGQDAVIITLGISENPIFVRLFGPKKTSLNIRSNGTKHVIEVMKKLRVNRLVVLTSYGTGMSKNRLRFMDNLFFNVLLKPQIDDTELQDRLVKESNLDWTIIQPVHLSDTVKENEEIYTSMDNEIDTWSISRHLVGQSNVHVLSDNNTIGKTIAISSKKVTSKHYVSIAQAFQSMYS